MLAPYPGSRWVDVGTGGGLPGLVAAIVRPDLDLALVEARWKKCEALEEFVRVLGLRNVSVRHGRAEDLARCEALRGRFDGSFARSVAGLPVAAELLRGFLRPGGTVALLRGREWAAHDVELSRTQRRRLGLGTGVG